MIDLWRSVSHSRHRWQWRRFCHHWKFHVQTEAYGYASLPADPRDADSAITGSRFASLGDAPFYRGSVCFYEYYILGLLIFTCIHLSYFTNPASWLPHWRWHSSDLRQRRTTRATTFVRVVRCTSTPLLGGAFVILSALCILYPDSGTRITRFRCCTLSWLGKPLNCIKAS